MHVAFHGEQFLDGSWRGHLEAGTQRFEFLGESLSVMLSRIMDTYDTITGVLPAAEPDAVEPHTTLTSSDAPPRRMAPRRNR